jgi:hypothetical protein
MKNLQILILSTLSIAIFACSDIEEASVKPNKALEKVTSNDRNLRPMDGEKPDLKVFPFFVSGSVTLVSGSYRIPISFKELNVGTANDNGAFADSLKVYQKIPTPIPGAFTYRHLNTFLRTANIPVGGSWYLNAIVRFPLKWRPSSGRINLVIRADAGNTIAELDETNNLSDTIWNINLP